MSEQPARLVTEHALRLRDLDNTIDASKNTVMSTVDTETNNERDTTCDGSGSHDGAITDHGHLCPVCNRRFATLPTKDLCVPRHQPPARGGWRAVRHGENASEERQ